MTSIAEAMSQEFERLKKDLQTQTRIIERMRDEMRDLRLEVERKNLEIDRLKEKCGEDDGKQTG